MVLKGGPCPEIVHCFTMNPAAKFVYQKPKTLVSWYCAYYIFSYYFIVKYYYKRFLLVFVYMLWLDDWLKIVFCGFKNNSAQQKVVLSKQIFFLSGIIQTYIFEAEGSNHQNIPDFFFSTNSFDIYCSSHFTPCTDLGI